MIQNHHAGEACGWIPTVFVTAHADDKVERAATRRHERALPSPLSFMMICQYRLSSSSVPLAASRLGTGRYAAPGF
jgi:hypothetical protein